jgi:hypothetical protein
LQLPAVGDFWHYSSNISLIPIAIGILPSQIFNKPLNRQLLVGAVIGSHCYDLKGKLLAH